jgi:hypothetical protein
MVSHSVFSAAVYSDDGADQGPIDVTGAENESQARDLARVRGIEWLKASVFEHATVRISRDGHALTPVEVRRG